MSENGSPPPPEPEPQPDRDSGSSYTSWLRYVNGWTVMLFLLFMLVGFVACGTEDQHEAFVSGLERILAATERLLK